MLRQEEADLHDLNWIFFFDLKCAFNPMFSQLSSTTRATADASQMSRKMDRGELSRLLPSVDPREREVDHSLAP